MAKNLYNEIPNITLRCYTTNKMPDTLVAEFVIVEEMFMVNTKPDSFARDFWQHTLLERQREPLAISRHSKTLWMSTARPLSNSYCGASLQLNYGWLFRQLLCSKCPWRKVRREASYPRNYHGVKSMSLSLSSLVSGAEKKQAVSPCSWHTDKFFFVRKN